jgi:hypothetical protein
MNNNINEFKDSNLNFEKKNNNFQNLNSSKLLNRQKIIMNNYKNSYIMNENFILNNIYSNDELIYNKIYNLIQNPYQKRINTINLILTSNISIPINNYKNIIKFFNWLSPLNNEYNMSSKDWNIKTVKYGNREKILLQNSISKKDMTEIFYSNYINLIKKKLTNSNIDYCYFEFKSKRFNKIKDIVWAF